MIHNRNRWVAVMTTLILFASAAVAFADSYQMDNDTAQPGNQNSIAVSADPGDPVSASAQVVIDFKGNRHLVAGSSVTFTYDAQNSTGVPEGAVVGDIVVAIPSTWGEGMSATGTGSVSFTAPAASAGITFKWEPTTLSCVAGDDKCLTGASALVIDYTANEDDGPTEFDTTPPTVTVTGVEDGGAYTLGAVPTAGCDTQDDGSGVATAASIAVTGGTTNGVGAFTATCSGAVDNAGNAADDVSASYSVTYGGISGILQPIKPDHPAGKEKTFSRGKQVPVKFQLDGDPVGGFDTSAWTVSRTECGSSSSTTMAGAIRYDVDGDQYVYNADLRSLPVGTCWTLSVTLDDGSILTSASFRLVK